MFEQPSATGSGKLPKLPPANSSSRAVPVADLSSRSSSSFASSSSRLQRVQSSPVKIDGMEIIATLGSGGMGSVYLAYEPLLDRKIAVKLLTRNDDENSRAKHAARFLSEAVLTGRLCHAGIIPIYHIGHDAQYGYYYTMRYVKGRTLSEIIYGLSVRDPAIVEEFSLNRLLTIFLRACEALGFAHKHGVLHRDIKPSNIIVADFGEVLVLDWGLAKEFSITDHPDKIDNIDVNARLNELRKKRSTMTQVFLTKEKRAGTGTSLLQQLRETRPEEKKAITQDAQILGTPGYLSPEQGEGRMNITPASDVYSLGVTLYEILTLTLPVEGQDNNTLVAATVLGNLVPIQKRPEGLRISKALCEIVTRALALNPEERFADAKELAENVALYLEGKSAWRSVASDKFQAPQLASIWSTTGERPQLSGEGMNLQPGARVRCTRIAMGDFRAECELWAESPRRWLLSLGIQQTQASEPQYEFRVGVEDRPFVELFCGGRRVQRRFDVRLQTAQRYVVKIEMEADYLRLWIDGQKYIEFKEAFAQSGGTVALTAVEGMIHVRSFNLISRGAPLHLPCTVLPDRLYRMGRYNEARELYRQVGSSHFDREEGMVALYKAGMCSVNVGDIQIAFDEFTRLEGTMYDHCCALGLSLIGMREGNTDWAWEALKNGYQRHRTQSSRSELWFALLSMIESIEHRDDLRITRYKELLDDLDPEPQEAGQVTFDLLDLIEQRKTLQHLRAESISLLRRFPTNNCVVREALLALSRSGIDEPSIPPVAERLEGVLKQSTGPELARFQLLNAELEVARGNLDIAATSLRDAIHTAGPQSSEGLWAQGWQVLLRYLSGQFQMGLTEVHEKMVRMRRGSSIHMSYFCLLEALCYLGKKQGPKAQTALQNATETDCIWGHSASMLLSAEEPSIAALAEHSSSHQIAEALFLIGEGHWMSDNRELAQRYYMACLDPVRNRAMFSRFIRQRLNTNR